MNLNANSTTRRPEGWNAGYVLVNKSFNSTSKSVLDYQMNFVLTKHHDKPKTPIFFHEIYWWKEAISLKRNFFDRCAQGRPVGKKASNVFYFVSCIVESSPDLRIYLNKNVNDRNLLWAHLSWDPADVQYSACDCKQSECSTIQKRASYIARSKLWSLGIPTASPISNAFHIGSLRTRKYHHIIVLLDIVEGNYFAGL